MINLARLIKTRLENIDRSVKVNQVNLEFDPDAKDWLDPKYEIKVIIKEIRSSE